MSNWKEMADRLAQRLRSLPESGTSRFPDARDRDVLKDYDIGEEQGLGKGYPSNTRTWGYYFTEAEAVEGMKRSCSDEGGY